jgi:hypothetical protein
MSRTGSKVRRCQRCCKRQRSVDGWNVEMIAGLPVFLLCPDCQTPQEDLDAELNWIAQQETQKTGAADHIRRWEMDTAAWHST